MLKFILYKNNKTFPVKTNRSLNLIITNLKTLNNICDTNKVKFSKTHHLDLIIIIRV